MGLVPLPLSCRPPQEKWRGLSPSYLAKAANPHALARKASDAEEQIGKRDPNRTSPADAGKCDTADGPIAIATDIRQPLECRCPPCPAGRDCLKTHGGRHEFAAKNHKV